LLLVCVFLRCVKGQRQSVHAALSGWSEFVSQRGVDRPRPRDPAKTLEGGADQQNAVVRLAAGGRAGMAGVMGAVVVDPQNSRGKCLGERGAQAIGSGWFCHGEVIDRFSGFAKMTARRDLMHGSRKASQSCDQSATAPTGRTFMPRESTASLA
jgi:hypothetical protein